MPETKTREIFESAYDAGKSKNDTIMALITDSDLDVTQAVREYQSLAKEYGIILTTKDRTDKVNELLSGYDLLDNESRKKAMADIADTYDVSEATAGAHIRKYAEQEGIELPSQNRNSLEDMVKFVDELIQSGKDRSEVVDNLQNEMGYTANSASSAYSRAIRELGLSTGRISNTVPMSELVSFMRTNQSLPKKLLATKMHEELGYAESTAGSFVTYVIFAKEWMKQEEAAAA